MFESKDQAFPQWLRNAHAALDRAVWAAYGWDDPDPAIVDEDAIVSRLLALSLKRAGRPEAAEQEGDELRA